MTLLGSLKPADINSRQQSRVWEREVSNAVHFGTLGYGHRDPYCVGSEIVMGSSDHFTDSDL